MVRSISASTALLLLIKGPVRSLLGSTLLTGFQHGNSFEHSRSQCDNGTAEGTWLAGSLVVASVPGLDVIVVFGNEFRVDSMASGFRAIKHLERKR